MSSQVITRIIPASTEVAARRLGVARAIALPAGTLSRPAESMDEALTAALIIFGTIFASALLAGVDLLRLWF